MNINKYPRVNGTPGITLLDYFAAKAMPVVIQAQMVHTKDQINPFNVGMLSYAIALGMLAAREQPEEAFEPKKLEDEPPAEEKPAEESSLIVP